MKNFFTLLVFLFFFSLITVAQPTAPASAVKIIPVSGSETSMVFSWTNGTGGVGRIVIVKDVNGIYTPPNGSASPGGNADYTASADLDLGGGTAKCVYNGAGNSVTVTNLPINTDYIVQVYEYSGSSASPTYTFVAGADNPLHFRAYTSTSTFTVPTTVTRATVQAWGGGGAGGGNNFTQNGGGGGGGGAYSSSFLTGLNSGDSYDVVVGTGGTGVASSAGNAGNDSFFRLTAGPGPNLVLARGGSGGGAATAVAGGAVGTGGASGTGLGTVVFSGGNGGAGRTHASNTGRGGGGGSSASATQNGVNGNTGGTSASTDGDGGALPSGGGGNGASSSDNAGDSGNPGSSPGGGGSGSSEGTAEVGGNGAAGLVIVSYTQPKAAITYSDADGYVKSGQTLTITATFDEAVLDAPIPQITLSAPETVGPVNMTKVSATVYTYDRLIGGVNGTPSVSLSTAVGAVSGNVVLATPTSGSTFTVDNTAPAASPVISITTNTGGTVVAGYYNSTNVANTAGITVRATIAADASLNGGSVQIQADDQLAAGFVDLGSAGIITPGNISDGYKDIVISHATLSGLTGGRFADGKVLSFRTRITDGAGNGPVDGATFGSTLTVDLTAPTLAAVDAVLTANANQVGGGSVTLTAGSATNTNWLAPAATTVFTANGTTITTAAGDATSITAPTTSGTYKLFLIDAAGNYSVASTNSVSIATSPVTAPSAVVFSNVIDESMTIGWTVGSGSRHLVIASSVATPDTDPTNFTSYTANSNWNSGAPAGTAIGNGYVVYDGTANSFSLTGLQAATTYYFAVYTYDGASTSAGAFNATQATGGRITRTQATNVNLTSPASTTATVNWTVGTGTRRMVIIKRDGGVFTPQDGQQYTANTTFTSGTDLDGGAGIVKCVLDGTEATVDVTGLTEDTEYSFQVFEYIGTGVNTIYLKGTGTGNPLIRKTVESTQPPNEATAASFPAVTANSITFQVTTLGATPGASRMIVVSDATIAFNPTDGVSYTANTDFSLGTDLDAGANTVKVVGYGSGPIAVTGLSADRIYHFAAFEFNGDQGSGAENYRTTEFATSRNTKPTTVASSLIFTTVAPTVSTIQLNWTNPAAIGGGDRRMVVVREGATAKVDPTDFTAYGAPNTNWGTRSSTNEIGSSGNYIVFNGTGSNVALTNLRAGTTYHFEVYEYNSYVNGGVSTATANAAYLTPSASASQATVADATLPAAFTTGVVTAKGGREVTGYYNSTNQTIEVVVPLASADPTLDGGTVQLQARQSAPAASSFFNVDGALNAVGSGLVSITYADRIAGTKTISVSEANLTGIGAGVVWDEGATIQFTAIITDYSGNARTGTTSATTTVIDETAPQISGNVTFSDGGGGAETLVLVFDEPLGLSNNDQVLLGTPGFSVSANPTATFGAANTNRFTTGGGEKVTLTSSGNNAWTTNTQVTYTAGGVGGIIIDLAGNEMATVTKATSDLAPPVLVTGMIFDPNGTGPERITFELSEQLTLAENADVIGFTSSATGIIGVGGTGSAKYSSKGINNIITLTSASNGQWTDANTISYTQSGSSNVEDPSTNELANIVTEAIQLRAVSIASNNTNTSYANASNTITVSFVASRPLTGTPTGTIGGQAVTVNGTGTTIDPYTASIAASSVAEGVVPVAFSFTGVEAAKSTTITITTNGSSVICDKTAPATPATAPDLASGDDSGASDSDNTTNQTSALTFSGPDGSVENNSTVRIYNGGTLLGTTTATNAGAYTVDLALSAGSYSLHITATDAAGNVSAASPTLALVIDTSVTVPTGFDLATADDTQPLGITTLDTDNITRNTTGLTITGAAENGASVDIYVDAVNTTTVTANGSGVFTVDLDLTAGTYSISARQTDVAGNTSVVSSSPLSLTIDTSAPSNPGTTDLNALDDTGISNTDDRTNQTTALTFTSAAVDANAYVRIFNGGTGISTVQANGTGVWTNDISLSEGTHDITIIAYDAAGNPSSASTIQTVIVDTTAPTLTTRTIASSNTNTSYARVGQTVTISFTADENIAGTGSTAPSGTIDGVAMTFTMGPPATPPFTTGTGSITTTASNTEGVLGFTFTVNDVAGNGTTATTTTNASSVRFDKTPPVVASITRTTALKGIGTTNGVVVAPNGSVAFDVVFTETNTPLSGIDATDFSVIADGSVTYGSPVVVAATGDPNTYTVTINDINGTGRIALGLTDNNSIVDVATNPLAGSSDGSVTAAYTASQYYTLVLPEPSNEPFTITESDITSNSITLSWPSVGEVRPPTHYLVLARVSTGPGYPSVADGTFVNDAAPLVANVARVAGTNTYTFTGLSSGTSYDFRVYKYSLAASVSNDNIDFANNADRNGIETNTASLSTLVLSSTAVPIGSIKTDNANSVDVLQFRIYDDGVDPISPNVMTLNLNGNGLETIVFTLRDELTLAEGASVTGFTTSTGTVLSAIYSGKGTTNTITLTSSANNAWTSTTTISYSAATGNAQFVNFGKMQPIVAHAIGPVTQPTITYFSNGVLSVPGGITSLTVEAWGGGGAGGAGVGGTFYDGAGGGGGGGYSRSLLSVTPGDLIGVTVGTGGVPNGFTSGGNGSPSSFGGLVVANGGFGGNVNTGGFSGPGGPGAGIGIGDVTLTGGNGGNGELGGGTPASAGFGGGGGSSAGTSSNGNSGVNRFAGVAPTGGGSGGNGITIGTGASGVFPGGGGGGSGNGAGGAGANGQVRVTFNTSSVTGISDWDADNSPFKFSQLVVTQGAANSPALADWQDIIGGAELTDGTNTVTGTVNATNITFSAIPSANSTQLGFIPDANGAPSVKTYTLRVWLRNNLDNTLAGTVDGLNLDFKLEPIVPANLTYDDVTNTNQKSSRLVSSLPAIESGASQIQVVASKLVYTAPGSTAPANTNPQGQIGVGIPFSSSSGTPNPRVYALDAFNNLDLDYESANGNTGAISNTLNLNQSTNSIGFVNGVLSLANFYFMQGNNTTPTNIVVNGVGSPAVTAASSSNVIAFISNLTTISDLTAPVSERPSFSSTTTAKPAFFNFDFRVSDDFNANTADYHNNDNLPTIIQSITINQNPNNGDNGGGTDALTFDDWRLSIAGAELTDGVNAVTITTPNVDILAGSLIFNLPAAMRNIADGGFKNFQLRIWLRNPVDPALRDILDNKDFGFAIDENSISITAPSNTTSTMASSSTSTADGLNVVQVTATQIDFTTQWVAPSGLPLVYAEQNYDSPLDADNGTVGAQSPVAKARDANQNLDTDWNTANGKTGSVATATPLTYPLANASVTLTDGVFTFDPTLQVTSAGNGTNGSITNLVLSSTGLTNGISNAFRLNYSASSDIARETTFTYPQNILYATANNQVADITTTTGVAVERFRIRDGGASADADGTATKMESVTIRVTNYQYIRRIALYEVGTSPGFASNIEIAELGTPTVLVNANTADYTFSGITSFQAPDNGTRENNFEVRVSFVNTPVQDNQLVSFEVVGIAAGGVSSAFATATPTGTGSSLTGDENKIEVVATKLDVTSPTAASNVSINTPFAPVIQARDANNNLDQDFTGLNGVVTSFSNAATVTMANGPVASTTQFTNGVLDFATAFPNFQFTTGNNNDVVTLAVTGTGPLATGISPVLTLKTTTLTAGLLLEPTSIPSTSTNSPGVAVFDFVVNDDDLVSSGTDAKQTAITQIRITQSLTENEITNWSDLIQSATLSAVIGGTPTSIAATLPIGTNEILFENIPAALPTDFGYIADNTSRAFTLRLVLRSALGGSLPVLVDNLKLGFVVNATDIVVAGTSSSFSTTETENSGAGTNAVSVVATKLKWTTNPTGGSPAGSLLVNKDISLQLPIPVVEALDVNNNRDLNYVDPLNITNTDGLLMSGTSGSLQTNVTTFSLAADGVADVTPPLTGGVYTFPGDFQFDEIGNGTMTASPSGLSTIVSTLERISTAVTVRVGVAGTITASATLAEPANISSIADDNNVALPVVGGTEVFDFTLNDDPGSTPATEDDGNPTRIQSILITQLPGVGGNTITDWSQAIAAAQLSDGTNSGFGTITANSISFGGGSGIPNALPTDPGYIADGASKTYTLKIWLKEALGGTLPFTIDGLRFGFEVTATNVVTNANGSTIINTENENSGPGTNIVDVDATQISYSQLDAGDNYRSPYSDANFPTTGSIYTPFNPRLGVEAHDANRNRDLDFTGTITNFATVTPGVTTNAANDPSGSFTAGTLKFPANFEYTDGNNQDGQLTMTAGGITSLSPSINIISSFDSWMYFDPAFAYATRIPFVSMQEATLTNSVNSVALARIILSDGGAPGSNVSIGNPTPGTKNAPFGQHNDQDGAFTKISSFTISLTNFSNIRKIALFDANGNMVPGTEQNPAATVTFSGLGSVAALTAPDNDVAMFYIRASFNEIVTADMAQIVMQITNATIFAGSKFPVTDGITTIGGVDGAGTGGDTSDPTQNFIDVVATSLDFVTQPSAFAGINEPIDGTTSSSTGIVHARDRFANLDTEFNFTYSISTPGAGVNQPGTSFANGILDLTGMQYTSAGVGTLSILANGINSSTSSSANSIPCSTVDVIHVTAFDDQGNGVELSESLKGGTTNKRIFGVRFEAQHTTATEPTLTNFKIGFFNKEDGTPYPYTTGSQTVFKNFKLFESVNGDDPTSLVQDVDVDINTIQSVALSNQGASSTSYDLVEVVLLNPAPLYDGNTYTYYLSVDVDVSVNVGTPAITPYLIDMGYGTNSNNHILTSKGSSSATVEGITRKFASTKPPVLVKTNPFNGQLNVDPALGQIELYFDVPVVTFDGVAELYDRYSGTKIATLTAANGFYQDGVELKNQTVNPLVFDLPAGLDLIPDSVYFIRVAKGKFSNIDPTDRSGISDEGFNLYGGISYNGVFYFKASSPKPPVLLGSDAAKYFYTPTTATFNLRFDQAGTVFYMIMDPAGAPTTVTNNQILSVAPPTGTVLERGSVKINQINPNSQFVTVNTDLTLGVDYPVYIFAQNEAQPTPIATSAPYGTDFSIGGTGPTIKLRKTAAGLSRFSNPRYEICSNSSVRLEEPIIISELANGEFSEAFTQTFNILLPTGFQFDITKEPTITFSGSDFSPLPALVDTFRFINTTLLQIKFINSGNVSKDNIVITDLFVTASANDLSGTIIRFSGNGLTIVPDGQQLARISSAPAPSISFDNTYDLANNFATKYVQTTETVTYIPDNYVDSESGTSTVRLIPILPKGDYGASSFSGSGLTDDILTLSAVSLNTAFNIVLSHTDQTGCVSTTTEQYAVYDHTRAIPELLPTPGDIRVCLTNTNFPGNPNKTLNVADSVSFVGLAGYQLIDLFAEIPAKAQGTNQIIAYGTAWEELVKNIPVVLKRFPNANLGQVYKTYNWEYSGLLHNDSLSDKGLLAPYEYFRQPTPTGQTYYTGGSLGLIEFTGVYQSTADFGVFIPFRQEVEIFVPAIPVVEVGGESDMTGDTPIFCESGANILINGYPAASAGSSVGYFILRDSATQAVIYDFAANIRPPGFSDNGNGTATLSPGRITNGYRTIQVDYIYQENNSPCSGTGRLFIRITPNPVADFITSTLCEDIDVDFSDLSTIAPAAGVSISKWEWDFSDPNSGPANTATIANPSHLYSEFGLYADVSLSVESNFGCRSVVPFTLDLDIGGTPVVDFRFEGVTNTSDSLVYFFSNSSVSSNDRFDSLIWAYGDGTTEERAYTNQPTNPGGVFTHDYADPGRFTVKLQVVSEKGCTAENSHDIILVPTFLPTDAAAYEERFETTNGDWQAAIYGTEPNATPSSWAWGVPSKANLVLESNNGQRLWTTNLTGTYNPNERTALYSPVFNLNELDRPMISFNSFVQMDDNDGVVIQYSTDNLNITDPNKVWQVLGLPTTGVDWYNRLGIASKPGYQTTGDYGWTDNENRNWLESKHILDNVKAERIIFRFALASDGTTEDEGFTVDNVRVGNRTRTVLIENFRNLGNILNEESESNVLKTFAPGASGTKLVKINYHVGFPKEDPFNLDNPQDPSARALYYNITTTPRARLDGDFHRELELFSQWGTDYYNVRTLKLAEARLEPTVQLNADGSVDISVDVTSLTGDLPPNAILHVAVVEKSIARSVLAAEREDLISTGETDFEYILKKLLPTAAGTRFDSELTFQQTRTFGPFVWNPDPAKLYPAANDLALVVFVQNETTKEIYQSEIVDFNDPPVVTGLEPGLTIEDVTLYPNPADEEVTILLPRKAVAEVKMVLFDQAGRSLMSSSIPKGDLQKTINVRDLPGSIYLMKLEENGRITYKRVMVVHRN